MKSASAFTEERAVQQWERNSETVNAKFTLRVIPSRVNAIITNDVTDEEASEVGIDIKNLKLGMRSASNQVAWLEPTKDAGKNVVLKTDTGAQANLMPLSLWKRAGTNANLQKKARDFAQLQRRINCVRRKRSFKGRLQQHGKGRRFLNSEEVTCTHPRYFIQRNP